MRNIFLNLYGQDIEINDDYPGKKQDLCARQSHYLLSAIGSMADSQLFWLYNDPVPDSDRDTEAPINSTIEPVEDYHACEHGIVGRLKLFCLFQRISSQIHHPYNSKSPPVLYREIKLLITDKV